MDDLHKKYADSIDRRQSGDVDPRELGRQLAYREGLAEQKDVYESGTFTDGLRVLLFYPNLRGMNMLPPSLALFSALLKERGHQVRLFDSTLYRIPGFGEFDSDKEKEKLLNARPYDFEERDNYYATDVFKDLLSLMETYQPQLIAATCSEDMFPVGLTLLKPVKEKYDVPVVLGGVFATFAPHMAIQYPEIDMVCVGEGEIALVELCARIKRSQPYDDIQNLWVKQKDGTIRKNPMGKTVDMTMNPMLDLSIFDDNRLYRPMQGRIWRMFPVETHRGCPYTCAFCNSPSQEELYKGSGSGMFFRKKPFEYVHKELLYLRDDCKAEFFYFWADTFFAYTEKEFDEFCEMYSDVRIPFWVQTRPETVKHDKIKKLKEIGLYRMAFGIEHGNEQFRSKTVDRRWQNDKIVDALSIPPQYDVPFSVNNIVGFPDETRELTFDTIELNRGIKSDSINAYAFSPFHGTALRKLAESKGYVKPGDICRSLKQTSILNMPQYPVDRIKGMLRTFVLYVHFPKDRWSEIERAETFDAEGDRIWENLRNELAAQLWKDEKSGVSDLHG